MRGLLRTAAAGVLAGSCLVLIPTGALAQDDPAPPETTVAPAPAATSTFTLPVLGAPLTVAVTTDVGGGLLDVALTPNDTYTATHVRSSHVQFQSNDGAVNVNVSAKHGGERVSVRSGSLGEIAGPSGWSGDVFGTGVTSGVDFTVSAAADGGPDITGVAVSSTIPNTVGATERGTEGNKQWAVAEVRFEEAGQSRTLRIKATVYTNPDDGSASLKITLGREHGRRIADGAAVGAHTWTGALCDGTAATVTYNVAADGKVTDVIATPSAEVYGWGNKTIVGFSRGEGVSIKVRSDDAGALVVSTDDHFFCGRNDPAVNTEVAPDAGDDESHGGWGGDHRGNGQSHGGWGGDHRGDGQPRGSWGGGSGGWGGDHRDGDRGGDGSRGRGDGGGR